jgi:hypothetical protein
MTSLPNPSSYFKRTQSLHKFFTSKAIKTTKLPMQTYPSQPSSTATLTNLQLPNCEASQTSSVAFPFSSAKAQLLVVGQSVTCNLPSAIRRSFGYHCLLRYCLPFNWTQLTVDSLGRLLCCVLWLLPPTQFLYQILPAPTSNRKNSAPLQEAHLSATSNSFL